MRPLLAPLAGVSTAVSLYVLAWGGWWTVLSLVALPRPRAASRSLTERGGGDDARLTVIVPAHNEERGIADTIESLRAAGMHLAAAPIILVVADNCTDATAGVAERHGTQVIVRNDPTRRGKGFALEYAIEHLKRLDRPPRAVVFVDADTTVSENFFSAIAGRLAAGARAVQVYYEVDRGDEGLASLRRLAFMLVHWARPLGTGRLRLGTGLKGNGMAMRWDVAAEGLGSSGIAEDAAMTLALARRGVAVAFEPRAYVRGYMAPSYAEARTQDERWERGRLGMLIPALRAAATALRRGRPSAAAAAIEVAAPPLTLLACLAGLNLGARIGVAIVTHSAVAPLHLLAAGSLVTYVAAGLAAARASRRDLAALRLTPGFVRHKLAVLAGLAARREPLTWQRTERR